MHYGNYSRQPSVEWERFYKTSLATGARCGYRYRKSAGQRY